MRTISHNPVAARPAMLAVLAVFLAGGCKLSHSEQVSPHPQEVASQKDLPGFKEFSDGARAYLQLHQTAEKNLPAVKATDLPEIITAHQQALARKIREARPGAQPGDIFTPQAADAFRQAIRAEFAGPQAGHALATIKQAETLSTRLEVNQTYPEGVPYTTVPPTLLLKLPTLPPEIAYRIVGSDLVLLDVDANQVVDLIPHAFSRDQ